MDTKRWTEIQALFAEVLEQAPATRNQFLKEKCEAVRRRIKKEKNS